MSGLEEMILSFRSLSRLDERTAELAAPLVDAAIKSTAAAGTSPEGVPWAPTKKGARAMVNAAKAIRTTASGNVIRQTLGTPEAFWHYGSNGAPRRPVIPDGGGEMPEPVKAAVDRARALAFAEITGARP